MGLTTLLCFAPALALFGRSDVLSSGSARTARSESRSDFSPCQGDLEFPLRHRAQQERSDLGRLGFLGIVALLGFPAVLIRANKGRRTCF